MTARATYHHGDLKAALVQAAVCAAREGGEEAIGLNRLAASVGVSASAAYRHFPNGLPDVLVAVADVVRRELAERITRTMSQTTPSRDRATVARRRFRASGYAYVRYVLDEPGLFQVACRHDTGRSTDQDPFGLLQACIRDLVQVGALEQRRARDAAVAAWAAVHGLALLLTEGPLRIVPPSRQHALIERTLDMVEAGLVRSDDAAPQSRAPLPSKSDRRGGSA